MIKVEILQSFLKDVKGIKNKSDKKLIVNRVEAIMDIELLSDIPNVMKLKSGKNRYRTRVGNYRIGFFYENNVLEIARVLDRKEFYDKF